MSRQKITNLLTLTDSSNQNTNPSSKSILFKENLFLPISKQDRKRLSLHHRWSGFNWFKREEILANSFLDGLSEYRKTLGLKTINVNWGMWEEVGMASETTDSYKESYEKKGIGLITTASGM